MRAPRERRSRVDLGLLIIPDVPVQDVVTRAISAEKAGFDAVWVADEKFYRDPFVLLGAVAAATSRVRVGTCVTDPYSRHPALIATAMATLHEQAPGRVVIGLGAGGSGFPLIGVERRSPTRALTEATAILKGLLANEHVMVDGDVLRFLGGRLNFEATPLPIFVAARGPAMLRTAGRIADGVITAPFASTLTLSGAVAAVQSGVDQRSDGVQPSAVARVDVAMSADPHAARDAVRYMVALPLWSSYPRTDYIEPTGVTLPQEVRDIMARRDYSAIGEAAKLIPDELIEHFAIAGTPDDVARRMGELAAISDQILINPIPTPDFDVPRLVDTLAEIRTAEFGS